jgi:hypothetical protein
LEDHDDMMETGERRSRARPCCWTRSWCWRRPRWIDGVSSSVALLRLCNGCGGYGERAKAQQRQNNTGQRYKKPNQNAQIEQSGSNSTLIHRQKVTGEVPVIEISFTRSALKRSRLFVTLFHGSLKSPLCSCVSITLPAASKTQVTASCERLKSLAKPMAFVIAFGSPYHRPIEWQRVGNQINAAMIVVCSHFVNRFQNYPSAIFRRRTRRLSAFTKERISVDNNFGRNSRLVTSRVARREQG